MSEKENSNSESKDDSYNKEKYFRFSFGNMSVESKNLSSEVNRSVVQKTFWLMPIIFCFILLLFFFAGKEIVPVILNLFK